MYLATKQNFKFYLVGMIKHLGAKPAWRLGLGLISLGWGWTSPQAAQAQDSPAVVRLTKMFSRDIRATMVACEQRGGVNLAAGTDRDGSVICGNGWRKSPVKYADYLDMMTDFLGASFLTGVRGGLQANSDLKPEVLQQLLATPEGVQGMRTAFEQSIAGTHVLSKNSPKSLTILSNRVIERILPIMRDPAKLKGLLGTSEEYGKIAQNFCLSSGMSMKQAKTLTPNLNSVQIYAICLHEAGLDDEIASAARKAR